MMHTYLYISIYLLYIYTYIYTHAHIHTQHMIYDIFTRELPNQIYQYFCGKNYEWSLFQESGIKTMVLW